MDLKTQPMGRDTFHHPRMLQAPSNPALDTCRDGTVTIFLGQRLTTLFFHTKKIFFLTSNLNFPSFTLYPLHLVLSLQLLVKSPYPASLWAPSRWTQ